MTMTATDTAHTQESLVESLQLADEQIRLGNLATASRMYWLAGKEAIEDTAVYMGWQLEPRRDYSDIVPLLAQWYPYRRLSVCYDSLVFLRLNAVEDYDIGKDGVTDTAENVRELIDMLEAVR